MDAHKREYAAAVIGMVDHTPHPGRARLQDGHLVTTWDAGDWVTFRDDNGDQRKGLVIEVLVDDGQYSQYLIASHTPGVGREHFAVRNADILIF